MNRPERCWMWHRTIIISTVLNNIDEVKYRLAFRQQNFLELLKIDMFSRYCMKPSRTA